MENETTTVKKKNDKRKQACTANAIFSVDVPKKLCFNKDKRSIFSKKKYEIPEGLMYVKLSKYENWL